MSSNDELMAEQEAARTAAAIRSRRARGMPKGEYACDACQDGEVEWHEPRREGFPATVLPCRVCHPIENRDRAEGHYLATHDVELCEWRLCRRRREDGARKRAMGRGWEEAPGVIQVGLVDDLGEF